MSPSEGVSDVRLRSVLGRARDLGLLGPGALERHIEHAGGFATAFGAAAGHGSYLDLGSGGGLPGLVLGGLWPLSRFTLVDAGERRCEFLQAAVEECGFNDRFTVLLGRAEHLGRQPELRGTFDGVVARSFGPPAVVAECAAPFLRIGGLLVVSEPPDAAEAERWPARELAQLGLGPATRWRGGFTYASMVATEPCPDRYPRRDGVPSKRPLF